jgi:8-oxo-dGTP pyrophosphatase MutT (NUDIX family)
VHEVVVGALVRDGRVLLVHRRPTKRVNPDAWDLPGGVMEAGESERAALERELGEELGVEIVPDSASPLCRVTAGSADDVVRLSAWLVRDWRGTPTNAAPDEHDDIAWFDLADLPPLAHPDVRATVMDAGGTGGR